MSYWSGYCLKLIESVCGGNNMDSLSTPVLIVAVLIILAIAAAVLFYLQKQRTKRLRSKFGPEYNRAVRAEGDERQAQRELLDREKRVERLHIKPLSAQDRDRFAKAWQEEQARFVDKPREAVKRADQLVGEVMRVRGYPLDDFEQRVADISVDHPVVAENYRIAHRIAIQDRQEAVGTEQLRQTMIHYRALFDDLLHDSGTKPVREDIPETRARVKEAGRR
jgi:hypothetical protein